MTESEAIENVKFVFNTKDTDYGCISKDTGTTARYKDKVFNENMSWHKEQNISNEIIECKEKIAELEAKVYAYERIIANSNFAPIIREISEEK